MELDNNDQADDELREIEERRAMEESGEIPQPPSPRPSTPAPRKGIRKRINSAKFSLCRRAFKLFLILPSATVDSKSSPKRCGSVSRYHSYEICRFHAA